MSTYTSNGCALGDLYLVEYVANLLEHFSQPNKPFDPPVLDSDPASRIIVPDPLVDLAFGFPDP